MLVQEPIFLDEIETHGVQLGLYAQDGSIEKSEAVNHFKESLPRLWEYLHQRLEEEPVDLLALTPETTLLVDITLVDNETIRAINRQYRSKDAATDVLSFSILADNGTALVPMLPQLQLGSILISLPWAEQEAIEKNEPLLRYLQERLIHGLLHLLGLHHDTEEDYQRVVALQQHVLTQLDKHP